MKAVGDGDELLLKLAALRVEPDDARLVPRVVDRPVAVVLEGERPVDCQPEAGEEYTFTMSYVGQAMLYGNLSKLGDIQYDSLALCLWVWVSLTVCYSKNTAYSES